MKKNLKRTLAKVMAVALTVSLLGTAADADAAKKIKLAKKSITIVKGKSKKVAIKNVKKKQVKKLTVKSSKKKVATVKKSGKTAIKVTGKKKGSAKITVNVTVKGKKKATKLTLKVKVKNATTPKPTTAPSQAPSQAPTQAPSQAPTQVPTQVPSQQPSQAPEENKFGVSDPYVITISEDNEAYADSVAKRLANGLDEEAASEYNKDPQFNADGSVTFTSTNDYNSGMTFYIDPDVKATTDGDGKTAYEAKKLDLTTYEKVRFTVRDAYLETSLKVLTDGNDWWSKGETWEGTDHITEGDRVVEYNLNEGGGLTVAQLKEAETIGIAWHNTVGESATLVKIELVGKRDPLPLPTYTPGPSPTTNPTQSPNPSQKPGVESPGVESPGNETPGNETPGADTGKGETPGDDKTITLTGAALGDKANYVFGYRQYGTLAVVKLSDATKLKENSKVTFTYEIKDKDGKDVKATEKINWQLAIKLAQTMYPTNDGGENIVADYNKTGGSVETTALTATNVTKIASNDVYLVVSTSEAGFNGSFKLLTVTVGDDDVKGTSYTPELSDKLEEMTGDTYTTPSGLTNSYAITAQVDLDSKNLKAGDKIKVYYTITGKGEHPFRALYGRTDEYTGKDDTAELTAESGSATLTVGKALTSEAKGNYRLAIGLNNDSKGGFNGSVEITKVEITPAE